LDDEDKAKWFREKYTKDLHPRAFDGNFADFKIPEKAEGFDEIRYEWAKENEAKEYLRSKIREKKKLTTIEDLKPGEWFTEKHGAWTKLIAEYKEKQNKRAPKKTEDGDDKKEDEDMEVDDIFSISDVTDMGNGIPMFKHFEQEDWALMQLRMELWLLQVAFKKDVNDEDRPAVREQHLEFYYGKYFKKQLSQRWYGVETWAELAKMIKDTVAFNDEGLTTPLDGEEIGLDLFIKHTEENRRERDRRIVAGDETARLKIKSMAFNPPADKGRGKGGWKKGSTVGGKGMSKIGGGKRW